VENRITFPKREISCQEKAAQLGNQAVSRHADEAILEEEELHTFV
jgi:hypothetical protein